METLLTVGVVAFLAWNERDRLSSIFAAVRDKLPGQSPAGGTKVSRTEAVEAVEVLIQFAEENDGMGELDHCARSAGRALWDGPSDLPREVT